MAFDPVVNEKWKRKNAATIATFSHETDLENTATIATSEPANMANAAAEDGKRRQPNVATNVAMVAYEPVQPVQEPVQENHLRGIPPPRRRTLTDLKARREQHDELFLAATEIASTVASEAELRRRLSEHALATSFPEHSLTAASKMAWHQRAAAR
jgi:hypothetical protein